jgi:hypothetical protein
MVIVLPSPQLIHQLLQVGRECWLRAHALLKPLAYGIADVAASLVIDLVGITVVLGRRHGISLGEFHLAGVRAAFMP